MDSAGGPRLWGSAPALAEEAAPRVNALNATPAITLAASSLSQINKNAYIPSAFPPPQEGAKGIRFDYNERGKIVVLEAAASWRIRLSDIETGNILCETTMKAGRVVSARLFRARPRRGLAERRERPQARLFGQEPRLPDPVSGRHAGNSVGWFPYAVKFHKRHQCRGSCAVSRKLIRSSATSIPTSNS